MNLVGEECGQLRSLKGLVCYTFLLQRSSTIIKKLHKPSLRIGRIKMTSASFCSIYLANMGLGAKYIYNHWHANKPAKYLAETICTWLYAQPHSLATASEATFNTLQEQKLFFSFFLTQKGELNVHKVILL